MKQRGNDNFVYQMSTKSDICGLSAENRIIKQTIYFLPVI